MQPDGFPYTGIEVRKIFDFVPGGEGARKGGVGVKGLEFGEERGERRRVPEEMVHCCFHYDGGAIRAGDYVGECPGAGGPRVFHVSGGV